MGVDAELYIRVPGSISHQAVRKKSVELVIAFGAHPFFLYRPEDKYGKEDHPNGRHALSLVRKKDHYFKEPAIEDGSTLVECHLAGRYYGPGYERGDIIQILGIAKWLRHSFDKDLGDEKCTLYYGGDSGDSLDELDDKLERELWDHFCSKDSRNYFTNERGWGLRDGRTLPVCDFCKISMSSSGGGADRTFVHCNGCGVRYTMDRAGKLRVRADDWPADGSKQEKVIPRQELDLFLYRAVAAMSLNETELHEAREIWWREDVRQGRSMRVDITVPWHLLSPDERAQAYERVSVKLAELAKQELEGKAGAS